MKNLTKVLAVVLALGTTLTFAADEVKKVEAGTEHPYKAKSPKLNRAQVDALLAKPDQLQIIDLRRPDELIKIGGLPVYLSIQNKELEKNLQFISKDRTIVTVSNHAGRAGAAADLLASKGYKVAGAIGVQDYEAEGGTLVKITPPAPKVADNSNTAPKQ